MIIKLCQLTEKIFKYIMVTKSQDHQKLSLHVYMVFSLNQVC